jgi:membrane fusion protein, heavy metal efflux system
MSNTTPPFEPQGLSRPAQLALVAIVALVALIGGLGVRLVVAPLANQPDSAAPQTQPGTFRPTKEQWTGLKVATVRAITFRPERVTEGNIAIDDDLTTPVFSPYSGRVIKLIAKLGDHVERGAPLMRSRPPSSSRRRTT